MDERISAWIAEEARDELPDRVFQAAFDRTRATHQRRRFPGWRFIRMFRLSPRVFAAGAAAIIIVVVGAYLYPRLNSLIGGAPSPSPTVTPAPGPTGQIAFQRTVEGNTDIYMMNLDGSGLVRLTDDPAYDWQPAWTPDGKTLVFARRISETPETEDMYALNVETNKLTRLTNLSGVEGDPRVSADGTMIAYDQWPAEPGTYVMGIDGSNPRRVFIPEDDSYRLVDWTSDGTGLYFDRGGAQLLRLDIGSGQITTALTGSPRWWITLSPDGSTFAFGSHTPPGGISIMNVDGSNVRHVTGSWTDGGPITWAPDGGHLAFAGPEGAIWVVAVDGTGLTRWTEGSRELAWRPAP
jgi:Tol biopolymer transport system component